MLRVLLRLHVLLNALLNILLMLVLVMVGNLIVEMSKLLLVLRWMQLFSLLL